MAKTPTVDVTQNRLPRPVWSSSKEVTGPRGPRDQYSQRSEKFGLSMYRRQGYLYRRSVPVVPRQVPIPVCNMPFSLMSGRQDSTERTPLLGRRSGNSPSTTDIEPKESRFRKAIRLATGEPSPQEIQDTLEIYSQMSQDEKTGFVVRR
jgi:hypothetical protein